MFKVICINDKWQVEPGHEKTPAPVVGEEVEVIEAKETGDRSVTGHYIIPGLWYRLLNYQLWHHSSHFAPVSDINETEFERNYNKELA